MSDKITVLTLHVREQQIAQLKAVSTKTDTFYEYQNRAHELPEIVVPISLPIYRMANYRTRLAQQSYIRREKKAQDFFLHGQENEAAQQIQHDILVKFAEQGRAGSVTPIVDVLKVEKQRQAILITSSGVVVNGNRRLAGMRHLEGSPPDNFREFSHVKCLVLPPTVTENEIIEIEIRLQMKQRTELDYDWINECIAIRELRDSGKTVKDLTGLMNKKKGEIESAINSLVEADLYLSEWLGRAGDYESIEDAEQLFSNIGDTLKAKSGDAQEVSRRIAWTLVDRRGTLKRRVYDFNPMFGKNAEEVAAKLAERYGVEVDQAPLSEPSSDDFEVDVDSGDASALGPLISLFDDPVRRDQLGDDLIEVCEEIIEGQKDDIQGRLPLNNVQKANGLLASVDLTRAAPESLDAITNQLDAVEAHVDRLKTALERIRSRTATAV